jgi:hypothetical protein
MPSASRCTLCCIFGLRVIGLFTNSFRDSQYHSLRQPTQPRPPRDTCFLTMMKQTNTGPAVASMRRMRSSSPFLVCILVLIGTCTLVASFSPPHVRLLQQPRPRRIGGGGVSLKVSTLHDFSSGSASPKRNTKMVSVQKQQQQILRDVMVVGSQAAMTAFDSVVARPQHQQQRIPPIWDMASTSFLSIPAAAVPLLPTPKNDQMVAQELAEMTVGLLLVLFATHWTLTFLEPALGSDLTCAARWAAINGFLVTLVVRAPHHAIHAHAHHQDHRHAKEESQS